MRYILIILLVLTAGCSNNVAAQRDSVAKVNSCQITREEFEGAYKQERMKNPENTASKIVFLQELIDRKLIILDAGKKSIDKDEKFLKMVERYWEEALVKHALEKKLKDITNSMHISEDDIQKYYNKMLKEGKTDKPYNEVYAEMKKGTERFKEQEMIDEWISELRKKADISINYNLIDNKKGK